jgi:hypothetical protein
VVSVEVDEVDQKDKAITLVDDEKTHNVRIVMGEPQISADDADQQEAQKSFLS